MHQIVETVELVEAMTQLFVLPVGLSVETDRTVAVLAAGTGFKLNLI